MAGLDPMPTLPYYAPGYEKFDFPDIYQIAEGDQQLSGGKLAYVDLLWGYIVKWGANVHIEEGLTMMWVAQHTTIPVPKVLAMWHDETGDKVIIMEKITGTTLFETWHRMNRHQKRDVLAQMRDHFTQMRSLAWPGYFGGVMGQRCLDAFVAGRVQDEPDLDPGHMTTEDHWVSGLFQSGLHFKGKEVPLDLQEPLREEAAKGNPGVFTHGDFHPANVMVDDDGKVFFIDWERAGWAPSYWERALILIGPAGTDNWADWTDDVAEILRDLGGGRPYAPAVQAIDYYYDWLQGQR